MTSPRIGSGRGVMHGRVGSRNITSPRFCLTNVVLFQIYSRNGTMVAVTSQEGVVRADRRGPSEQAKL